jgi:Ice-binding-like
LKLKALAIVPIAIVSMLAATTTVASAAPEPAVTAAAAYSVQTPVDLGSAGNFAILSKSGITDVYRSAIVGDVGSSPITGAAIGLKCDEVTGTIYTVNAAGPACRVVDPTRLTASIGAMETAYNDAAGRVLPDVLNLGAGQIGGLTLTPGLYKWTTSVSISNDVTLSGGPNDVFILQIAGNLSQASAKNVTLAGGVQAKNVFWQTAGAVSIGTTAHFEGNILSKTMIAVKTKASVNGRLFAQTAVTLQMNAVTRPAL